MDDPDSPSSTLEPGEPYPDYAPPPDIDRRQKLAACLLLGAMDLPMPVNVAACQLLEAARVCPGVTLDELPGLGEGSRRLWLAKAACLIEEMLVEIAP